MNNFLILLPPSEGKQPDGSKKPIKEFSPEVKPIGEKLSTYSGDWGKLLGVKGASLEKAINTNQNIKSNPTMKAIERYSGVVFNGVDFATLSPQGKKYFNKHVRIISGLFGLVHPEDLIPDYKLKIDKLGSDKYWNPIITEKIKKDFIIDLLPQAHAKALNYTNGIRIDFVINKNGQRKPAGHNGKLIKGRFVRWLCENQITDPKEIHNFKEDDFIFDNQNFLKTLL